MSGVTANASQTFAYDATGNRTGAASNGQIDTYTTSATSNRLSQINNAVRNYDTAGNTTDWTAAAGTLHATYSQRNRLSQVNSTHYVYNAWGERVAKQGNATTQFVYDDDGHLAGEYDAVDNLIEETIWLDNTPVAVLKAGSGSTAISNQLGGQATGSQVVFWIEPDQLDTPRAIVNQTHQVLWQWESTPFGETQANENPNGLGAFTYNLRFPGQYFDQETGTHYNYFRDYEPGTARYVESDPSGLAGGINTYAYSEGDSIGGTDFDGLSRRRPPHTCTGTLCRNGRELCSQTISSGGAMSSSWPDQINSHTEAKHCKWASGCGQSGDTLNLVGTYAPCSGCKGHMNALHRECGISSCYSWPGGTWNSSPKPPRRRR